MVNFSLPFAFYSVYEIAHVDRSSFLFSFPLLLHVPAPSHDIHSIFFCFDLMQNAYDHTTIQFIYSTYQIVQSLLHLLILSSFFLLYNIYTELNALTLVCVFFCLCVAVWSSRVAQRHDPSSPSFCIVFDFHSFFGAQILIFAVWAEAHGVFITIVSVIFIWLYAHFVCKQHSWCRFAIHCASIRWYTAQQYEYFDHSSIYQYW